MVIKKTSLRILFILIFGLIAFGITGRKCDAAERVMNGTYYLGNDPRNGWSVIDHVCQFTVESGDTLILDGARIYGRSDSSANNGFKVKRGGTLIVKNTQFYDTGSIHIVLEGGTVYLYSGFSTPDCYEFCAGEGTVYIEGGTWEANRHDYGGEGVFYLFPGSNVFMNGGRVGTITKPHATSTSYTTQYGFNMYGASFNMTGGTIENCLVGVLARNVYMSGGTVKNCNQTSIANKGNSYDFDIAAGVNVVYGKGEFTGGVIDNCEYGIANCADTVLDGTVVKNNDYGVVHMDEYFSQKTKVEGSKKAGVYVAYEGYHVSNGGITEDASSGEMGHAGIVLEEDYFITVDEKPEPENGTIGKVYISPQHRFLGRVVATIDYEKTIDASEYVKPFTVLTFDGWEYRSGLGTNSAVGNLILSKAAYVKYDKNFIMSGFDVRMKNKSGNYLNMNSDELVECGFWKEPCEITSNVPEVYVGDNQISNMYFSHWNLSPDDLSENIEMGGVIPGEKVSNTVVLYAFYDIMPNLFYRGNGQTVGEDYIKDYALGEEYILDESIFEKAGYSHQGWGVRNDLIYSSEGVNKAGTILDIKAATEYAVEHNEYVIADDGEIAINIYSVWDKIPEIKANDIVVLIDDENAISFDTLFTGVTAEDFEDGKLEPFSDLNNLIYYTVSNYSEEELRDDVQHMSEGGAVLVELVARDGAGNEAYNTFWIYINGNAPTSDRVACYTRSISRQAYDTRDNSLGGCLEGSKWYSNEACVSSISIAFDNMDKGVIEEGYELNHDTRLSAIEWILQKGFSNVKTDSAVKEWGRTLNKT